MTREELEAALGDWTTDTPPPWQVKATVINAARMQLALMPEKCGTCDDPHPFDLPGPICPDCHGSGKVYPPETVEKIAEAIDSISDEVWGYRGRQAVAVLDALGETE